MSLALALFDSAKFKACGFSYSQESTCMTVILNHSKGALWYASRLCSHCIIDLTIHWLRGPHSCSFHFLFPLLISIPATSHHSGKWSPLPSGKNVSGRKSHREELGKNMFDVSASLFLGLCGTKGLVYLAAVRKQAERRAGGVQQRPRPLSHTCRPETDDDNYSTKRPQVAC